MGGMPVVARRLRPLDFVFAAAVLGLALFLFIMLKKNHASSKRNLIVRSSVGGEYVFPLDRDGQYEIPGSNGKSVIEVNGGRARFLDSACPNRTCVQQGFISASGGWAACLPNNVLIMIEGEKSEGLPDAVAE